MASVDYEVFGKVQGELIMGSTHAHTHTQAHISLSSFSSLPFHLLPPFFLFLILPPQHTPSSRHNTEQRRGGVLQGLALPVLAVLP